MTSVRFTRAMSRTFHVTGFRSFVDKVEVMSEFTVRRRTHRGNNERWRLSLNHESI